MSHESARHQAGAPAKEVQAPPAKIAAGRQSSSGLPYAIGRKGKTIENGSTYWCWLVNVERSTHAITRSFADGVYGDKAAALSAATAYRDAAMHLLPPQTRVAEPNQAAANQHRDFPGLTGLPGVFSGLSVTVLYENFRRGGRAAQW